MSNLISLLGRIVSFTATRVPASQIRYTISTEWPDRDDQTFGGGPLQFENQRPSEPRPADQVDGEDLQSDAHPVDAFVRGDFDQKTSTLYWWFHEHPTYGTCAGATQPGGGNQLRIGPDGKPEVVPPPPPPPTGDGDTSLGRSGHDPGGGGGLGEF